MKIMACIVMATLITLISAQAADPQPRSAPYPYCNVYLSDMCFGIDHGDKLTMELKVDFIVYHVAFGEGGSASLYYGYNPSSRGLEAVFHNCEGVNQFSDCKRGTLKDGSLELLARRDRRANFVHVIISPDVPQNVSSSFLGNVRACTRTGTSITCAP